ncbi:hypothetical protein EDD80_105212 [Anseongella ginsenosidimutans]|uniref:Uncharacterized protein n=1 Tax=Anseongella ginsenosidimutans TaxID=496056 RepID=A0A4R3KSA8_9SPHI|nr:hypothetical protein [Anseongella ginsenosidimutans]QEC52993.1 hypothetical protein FRZ59_12045 [Anseongella ginsenosidimutans]TCS87397.1 hypothetical protein EDD80_105212 [Anseongella ginsenosidimutans]
MKKIGSKDKRVVVLQWKEPAGTRVEVFSNLKNLCLNYPEFNYNTLNNYLGKGRTAYEKDHVKIERKTVLTKPDMPATITKRSIAPVVRTVKLHEANDSERDLIYWLAQPPKKRLEAVAFIVSQSLTKNQRMDKTSIRTVKINE